MDEEELKLNWSLLAYIINEEVPKLYHIAHKETKCTDLQFSLQVWEYMTKVLLKINEIAPDIEIKKLMDDVIISHHKTTHEFYKELEGKE